MRGYLLNPFINMDKISLLFQGKQPAMSINNENLSFQAKN